MSEIAMGIPAVDLNDFISGTPEQKAAFVKQLGEAYENIGFVAVRNHLIDPATQEKLYHWVKSFFELPDEVKMKYEIAGLAGEKIARSEINYPRQACRC